MFFFYKRKNKTNDLFSLTVSLEAGFHLFCSGSYFSLSCSTILSKPNSKNTFKFEFLDGETNAYCTIFLLNGKRRQSPNTTISFDTKMIRQSLYNPPSIPFSTPSMKRHRFSPPSWRIRCDASSVSVEQKVVGPHTGRDPNVKKPEWLRQKAPQGERFQEIKESLSHLKLNTVCEEAQCPNIGEVLFYYFLKFFCIPSSLLPWILIYC